MLQVIGIMFAVGVGGCAVLWAACVVRRVLVVQRISRWISSIEHAVVNQAVRSPRGSPCEEAPLEAGGHVHFYSHMGELVDAVSGSLSQQVMRLLARLGEFRPAGPQVGGAPA